MRRFETALLNDVGDVLVKHQQVSGIRQFSSNYSLKSWRYINSKPVVQVGQILGSSLEL